VNPIDQFMSGTQLVGAMPSAQQGPGGVVQRVACGIPRSSIAAAATYDATIVNQEPFRPDRIVLSTAAEALDVTNVRVGTKSLNLTSNPISGRCFAADAVNTQLQGYTATPGVGFVISFVNNTAGAITTSGGVFGWAVN